MKRRDLKKGETEISFFLKKEEHGGYTCIDPSTDGEYLPANLLTAIFSEIVRILDKEGNKA